MSISEKPLHVDIPVQLAQVKVAFSIAALAFEGDLPASIFHLQLITTDVANWNAKAQVIAVFHTNAGHVTLNDVAYNTERMIPTGNPYKELVADLMKRFKGTNVEDVEGDATALTFEDERFSGAVCFSMLHHVPTPALQDQLFAEARRVLRPGAVFAATDSLNDPGLRDFHKDDTFVPVDPDTLTDRLHRAGFVDVEIDRNQYAWKATARSVRGSRT